MFDKSFIRHHPGFFALGCVEFDAGWSCIGFHGRKVKEKAIQGFDVAAAATAVVVVVESFALVHGIVRRKLRRDG